eukprot:TRINITY_DN10673_c0_g1_i1.p1 TRINITY_DN10673_c0_g1~~TRINITY_DN10673_c0_g1_i1.p1  ORF type:complete len:479 (-),score=99.61 TRINITY_DN10673_c0_g1_i1:108-1544(-)
MHAEGDAQFADLNCPSSLAKVLKQERLQGRFTVSYDQMLGRGSFGTVYKGLDFERMRAVAIKLYDMEISRENAVSHYNTSIQVLQLLGVNKVDDEVATLDAGYERRPSFNISTLQKAKDLEVEHLVKCPAPPLTDSSFLTDDDDIMMGATASISSTTSICFRRSQRPGKQGDKSLRLEVPADAQDAVEQMDLTRCFVELLGYSTGPKGLPGIDSVSSKLYIVTELGEETLSEVFERYAAEQMTFSMRELQRLQWDIVSIVCGLHLAGFVHMDIKPTNIMRFGNRWKLIDFDSSVKARSRLSIYEGVGTAIYLAPEVATAMTKGDEASIKVSRLMDVWSAGLCCMEAVFLKPVLEPWYNGWLEQTKSETKFFAWLGDLDTEHLISGDMKVALDAISPEMTHLLHMMLEKDPLRRCSISDCTVHPWFAELRAEMWKQFAQDNIKTPFGRLLRKQRDRTSITSGGSSSAASHKATKACSVM